MGSLAEHTLLDNRIGFLILQFTGAVRSLVQLLLEALILDVVVLA